MRLKRKHDKKNYKILTEEDIRDNSKPISSAIVNILRPNQNPASGSKGRGEVQTDRFKARL